MSNQDLKQFSKSDFLGFAGAVFHGFLPPEEDLTTKLTMYEKMFFMISKNTIPYIGTEILDETCDGHNSTQNAPKSIIPDDFKRAEHFPSFDSVKSRLKAIFKK